MTARAVVVVPFFNDAPGDEAFRLRERNFTRVLQHLWDGDFVTAVSMGPANRAGARNEGTRPPFLQYPVIVFNDADTLVPHDQIRTAIELAAAEPGLVYAYSLYLRLGPEGGIVEELWAPPSMACAAISRACFEEVGGFDETYEGWGYEDCDFALRCGYLWRTRRVDGPAEHLWHGDRRPDDSPEDADPELVARNLERWRASTS